MTDFASALTLDIPRARKTLEHLIAHPEEHDQLHFGKREVGSCGTVMCIAGTTVYQDAVAGGQIRWREGFWDDASFMAGPGDDNAGWVQDTARELLGLSHDDAESLFFTWVNRTALSKLSSWIDAAEKAQADAL